MRRHFFITGTDTGVGKDDAGRFAVRGARCGLLEADPNGNAGRFRPRDGDAAGGHRNGPHARRSVQVCAAGFAGSGGTMGGRGNRSGADQPADEFAERLADRGGRRAACWCPSIGKQFMLDMMVKFKLPVILAARSGAGHHQSHVTHAGGAARGGIAGAWRGADRRSEPREPRNHREIRPRSRDRRNSQTSESASHRAHAGFPESL